METVTRWYHLVAYFFGGAFLANTIPHLVSGISGSPFKARSHRRLAKVCPLRRSMFCGECSTWSWLTCVTVHTLGSNEGAG